MIMIAVPGPWKDFTQLFEAMRQAHGPRYFISPQALWDADPGEIRRCAIELREFEPDHARRFRIAGQGELSEATLHAIASSRQVVYVVSDDAGYEAARTVAEFGARLLQAGGHAVMVETAGVAHEKERWLADFQSENLVDIYQLFVTLIGDEECDFSCGMHNFGLPDAAVESRVRMNDAADVIHLFNFSQLAESPRFVEGETFTPKPKSRPFILEKKPFRDYEPDSPLCNPNGLWYMTRARLPFFRWFR